MALLRLIAEFSDRTEAEVIFNNAQCIFTTITNSANVVARWIDEAVPTYGPSSFSEVPQAVDLHIERSPPHGTIALLQLFVGNRCLLYQLLHRDASPPRRLYEFLNDGRFCFTGISAEQVVHDLLREYGFAVRLALDLGDAASRRLQREDLRWAGLERLASEMMMGFVIDQPDEVLWSAWRERVLHPQQIIFACANSFVSYELGRIVFSCSYWLVPFLNHVSSSIP